MTYQLRFVVVYKDGKDTRNRYYGPFVSISLAQTFLNDLPDPLPGGNKVCRAMEPYTQADAMFAKESILRTRELTSVINSIVLPR